jgi:hypothetical protein
MCLAPDHEMVDTLAPDRTDQAFGKVILATARLMQQACPGCCVYRKLDPHVFVMQSTQDRTGEYAANRLDPARDRRILVQDRCVRILL